MAHDFSTVSSLAASAGNHVTTARTAVESIHDANTKEALRPLVEAVAVTVDAVNQLVDALNRG